ncbi:MAG: serine/threonine-protein kinase [Planctomycetota bacterium]|nr:serine/threonine-protein kinase [Planctomycetota bacterium]
MTSNLDKSKIDEDLKPTRRFQQSSEDGEVEDFIETKRRGATDQRTAHSEQPLGLHESEDGAEATTIDAAKYGADTVSVAPDNPFLSGETESQAPPTSQQIVSPDFLSHKYILGVELDRGGMGRVFSAICKTTDEKVVIKVLSFMGKADRRLVRFHREAGALSLFKHDHILHLREFGVHWEDPEHGVPYLVTDCVPGPNLLSIVRESLRATKSSPKVDWLIKQFKGVAEALAECHKTGIIHRDIKPANVVIDEIQDRAVLIDFGLSKADPEVFQDSITAFKETLTATGQVLGTPLYMAPEQLFGVRDQVGPGSDVWGFAATFFYCLTGRLPFDGESPLDLGDAMESEDPPPLRQFNAGAPQWLESMLQDCFKKDVRERPTMSQLLNRMRTLDANEKSNRGRRGNLLWLAIVPVLLLMLFALWPKSTSSLPKAPVLFLQPSIERTSKANYVIRGRVEGKVPLTVLIIPGKRQGPEERWTYSSSGPIHRIQALVPGLNTWTVRVVDADDKTSETIELRIFRE